VILPVIGVERERVIAEQHVVVLRVRPIPRMFTSGPPAKSGSRPLVSELVGDVQHHRYVGDDKGIAHVKVRTIVVPPSQAAPALWEWRAGASS
jgi:hypothetical protein